jgi:endonuclease/exonuclease/phosphatase (EEP) superfamily protein YafD
MSIRPLCATVLSVIIVEALLVLGSRYVLDSWYFYIIYSLQLQISIILLLLSLVSIAARLNAYTIFQFLAVALLTAHTLVMSNEFAYDPGHSKAVRVKLISFNILGSNVANGERIAYKLMNSGADVVFLQESAPIGSFIDKIKEVYPYRLGCGAKTVTCDLSLWSKRPLEAGSVTTISPIHRDRMMSAVISIHGQRIRFVTAHMSKPYFDEAHAFEVKRLGEFIESTQEPVVVAGDFNASILSPDIQKMLRVTGMNTAREEPATWPVEAPSIGVAIDHIFTRRPLAITTIDRFAEPYGSNHYGLEATLILE